MVRRIRPVFPHVRCDPVGRDNEFPCAVRVDTPGARSSSQRQGESSSGAFPQTRSCSSTSFCRCAIRQDWIHFSRQLYDPASPSYRHFLTVPEFTERFGPSQARL